MPKYNLKFKFLLKILFILFYVLGLAVLLRSVILFGYHFQFNADEVFNANSIYLIVKGFRPYVDFYTVYSPIFHWFLTPIFLLFGFSFKTVSMARIVMIVFFLIRLFLMFLLVSKVFGKRTGFLFIPLYLLNPFVVFAEMQIRSDNLMMLFYTLFLLVFSAAVIPSESEGSRSDVASDRKLRFVTTDAASLDSSSRHSSGFRMTKGVWYFLSGTLFALTLLTNIKIVPSLIAFGMVFLYYIFQKRNFSQLWKFINGFCLTFLAFFAYFLIKGYLPEMFLHVFLDPFKLNNSIPYPTWLGYFYFSNPTIFGLNGKPMNWMYAWSLPVMAFAGGYLVLKERKRGFLKIVLFVSLVFHWVSMLFINSVFIQYYIPLNWLYSVFAAYLINDILFNLKPAKLLQKGMVVSLLVLFILLYKTSIKGNLARAKMTDDPIVREMEEKWRFVPPDTPAFPNVVFRPPIYPVLWGSTFAEYMRDRHPQAYLAIEKHKLAILVGLNDEYFSYLDKNSQDYISRYYQKDKDNPVIWQRIVK